jgi:RNA polymerase sigma factor (sigma-70 family)
MQTTGTLVIQDYPRTLPQTAQRTALTARPRHEAEALPRTTSNLLERALDGDRESLSLLIGRFRSQLLGMVRTRLGNGVREYVESRDIVQEVLVELVQRFPRCAFRREAEFVAWLKKILCNKIRDQARKLASARVRIEGSAAAIADSCEAPVESPSASLLRRERLEQLERALETLSVRHERIIRLRDIDGRDYRAVASELGLPSLAAARMLRRRAWVALTRELEQRLDERPGRRPAFAD